MSEKDELRKVVVNAIKDNIRESVDNGLKKFELCDSTRDYFAALVVLAMEENALDDMFDRLVGSE